MILTSILLNLCSILVVRIKSKTFINPIIIALVGFFVSGCIYQFGTLIGSTHESSILSHGVKLLVVMASFLMLIVAFLIRRKDNFIVLKENHIRGIHTVLGISVALIFISTILLLRKNDWIPVFLNMGRYYGLGNLSYRDVLVPLFTPLSFGLFRGIFLLQIIRIISLDENFMKSMQRYWKSNMIIVVCTTLILMTGLRAPIFDIIIMSIMAYVSFYTIKVRQQLAIGGLLIGFLIFFLLLGNQRMGISGILANPFSDFMGVSTGIAVLDGGLGWLNAYAGTVYLNLNSIVEYYPYTNHGLGILKKILPDFISAHTFQIYQVQSSI